MPQSSVTLKWEWDHIPVDTYVPQGTQSVIVIRKDTDRHSWYIQGRAIFSKLFISLYSGAEGDRSIYDVVLGS